MEEKKFKILSIDGGGIRGVFPAKFLAEMEAKLKEEGKDPRLCNHYDMICGTSTGGIIALALANGIPAQDIVDLYINNRWKIFPKIPLGLFNLKAGILTKKYYRFGLESLIKEKFKTTDKTKDLRINDLKTRVCVTGYDLLTARPKVFKTPHHPQLFNDKHLHVYQVALATSAAPTYFNPYSSTYSKIDSTATEHFNLKLDGGVFANNPTLIGILEANRGLEIPLESLEVLSIGTGTKEYQESKSRILFGLFAKPFGKLYWINKVRILELVMQAQSQHVDDLVNIMHAGIGSEKKEIFKYERIQIKLNNTLDVSLDTVSKDKLNKLSELAKQEFQKNGSRIIKTLTACGRWGGYPSNI